MTITTKIPQSKAITSKVAMSIASKAAAVEEPSISFGISVSISMSSRDDGNKENLKMTHQDEVVQLRKWQRPKQRFTKFRENFIYGKKEGSVQKIKLKHGRVKKDVKCRTWVKKKNK